MKSTARKLIFALTALAVLGTISCCSDQSNASPQSKPEKQKGGGNHSHLSGSKCSTLTGRSIYMIY